jgi:hypothetical protein
VRLVAENSIEFNRGRGIFLDRLRRDARLSATARLVGSEIAMRLNAETGYAWPSHSNIKEQLGVAEPTVKRAVADPQRHGYFAVERRRTRTGRKNYYRALGLVRFKVKEGGRDKHDPEVGIKKEGGRDQNDRDVGIKKSVVKIKMVPRLGSICTR